MKISSAIIHMETLASKVLGFTGGDNQGIIGLEVKYEKYLKGQNGMILTTQMPVGLNWMGLQKTASNRYREIHCSSA